MPEYYYKYYRINDNLINSIAENYFWMSTPAEFNDPFDARLMLDTDSSLEEIDEHISEMFKNSELKEDARKVYANLRESDPALLNDFVNIHPLTLLNQIGIACFTRKCDNLLMWAHYADNHKGVCMKFDLNDDEELSKILFPISYARDYPKLNFIDVYKDGNFEDLFLTKSSDWLYEEEWRLVQTKNLSAPGEDEPEEKNYGKLFFKKVILKEVIFGCKVSEPDIQKVIKAFELSDYSGIIFNKAKMIDFKFGLSFHGI